MDRRMLGLILLVVGAVGLVMSGVSYVVYGTDEFQHIHTMAVYGLLGLLFFSTGYEFMRTATSS